MENLLFLFILFGFIFAKYLKTLQKQASMSIKDRINFWEQMKAPQQAKIIPKITNLQQKKTVVPVTSPLPVKLSQQQNLSVVSQKLPSKQYIKQIDTKKNDSNPQKQPVTVSKQIQHKPFSFDKQKVQEEPKQNQDKIISVKDNIKKFNNLPIPSVIPTFKSCVVFKKHQTPKKEQDNEKKTQFQVLLSISAPLYEVVNHEEHQMSFKQKQMMLQKSLAHKNDHAFHTKKHEENSEHKENEIKQQEQTQQNSNLENNQHDLSNKNQSQSVGDKQRTQNELSNKIFEESMKEQEQKSHQLVTGESNNLTLETRMTRRVKRKNNDDDFDDL